MHICLGYSVFIVVQGLIASHSVSTHVYDATIALFIVPFFGEETCISCCIDSIEMGVGRYLLAMGLDFVFHSLRAVKVTHFRHVVVYTNRKLTFTTKQGSRVS